MDDGLIGDYSQDMAEDGQRRGERDSLMLLARIGRAGGASETVRVRNVSSGGLMAQTAETYSPGSRVEVELEGVGRISGSVAWAEAGRIGVAFDHPIEKMQARKARGPAAEELFRPLASDHRRPPLRPR